MEIDVPVCGLMLAIDIRRLPFRGGFTWDASGHGTGVWSLEPGSWVICDILECMLPQGQHASCHIRKKKYTTFYASAMVSEGRTIIANGPSSRSLPPNSPP